MVYTSAKSWQKLQAISVGMEAAMTVAAGWSGSADPVAAESAFIDAVARTKRKE